MLAVPETVSEDNVDSLFFKSDDTTTATEMVAAAAEKNNPNIMNLYFQARIDQPRESFSGVESIRKASYTGSYGKSYTSLASSIGSD